MTSRLHAKGEVQESEYRGSREVEVSGHGCVNSDYASAARTLSGGLSDTVRRTMETAYEMHKRGRSDE